MRLFRHVATVFVFPLVAFLPLMADCPPTSVTSYYYQCCCEGSCSYMYITVCQGSGGGCDPVANHEACLAGGDCQIYVAGGCAAADRKETKTDPLPKDALTPDFRSHFLASSKPNPCPAEVIFEKTGWSRNCPSNQGQRSRRQASE